MSQRKKTNNLSFTPFIPEPQDYPRPPWEQQFPEQSPAQVPQIVPRGADQAAQGYQRSATRGADQTAQGPQRSAEREDEIFQGTIETAEGIALVIAGTQLILHGIITVDKGLREGNNLKILDGTIKTATGTYIIANGVLQTVSGVNTLMGGISLGAQAALGVVVLGATSYIGYGLYNYYSQKEIEGLLKKGEALEAEGNYKGALEAYKEAHSKAPEKQKVVLKRKINTAEEKKIIKNNKEIANVIGSWSGGIVVGDIGNNIGKQIGKNVGQLLGYKKTAEDMGSFVGGIWGAQAGGYVGGIIGEIASEEVTKYIIKELGGIEKVDKNLVVIGSTATILLGGVIFEITYDKISKDIKIYDSVNNAILNKIPLAAVYAAKQLPVIGKSSSALGLAGYITNEFISYLGSGKTNISTSNILKAASGNTINGAIFTAVEATLLPLTGSTATLILAPVIAAAGTLAIFNTLEALYTYSTTSKDYRLYKDAKNLCTQGKYKEAIIKLDQAIGLISDKNKITAYKTLAVDILKLLGNKEYSNGHYLESLASYNEALNYMPDDKDLNINKVVVLIKLKEYGDAIKAANRALKIDYNNQKIKDLKVYSLNELGKQLYNSGKYKEALINYNEALQIDNNNQVVKDNKSEALFLCGTHLYNNGQYAEAIEKLIEAYNLCSNGYKNEYLFLWWHAAALDKQGDFAASIMVYEFAISKATNAEDINNMLGQKHSVENKVADNLYIEGKNLYNNGQYAEAMGKFVAAYNLCSEDYKNEYLYLWWHALALAKQGKLEEAVEKYAKTISKAINAEEKEKIQKQKDNLENIIKDNQAEALYEDGKELYAQGNYKEAIIKFDEAIDLTQNESKKIIYQTNKASVLGDLGTQLYNSGQYEESIQNLDLALELTKNTASKLVYEENKARALNAYAIQLHTSSRYKEAIIKFDEALSIKANNQGIQNNKATVLNILAKQQWKDMWAAKEAADKAEAGSEIEKQNREKEELKAIEIKSCYELAVQLNPDNYEYKMGLIQINAFINGGEYFAKGLEFQEIAQNLVSEISELPVEQSNENLFQVIDCILQALDNYTKAYEQYGEIEGYEAIDLQAEILEQIRWLNQFTSDNVEEFITEDIGFNDQPFWDFGEVVEIPVIGRDVNNDYEVKILK